MNSSRYLARLEGIDWTFAPRRTTRVSSWSKVHWYPGRTHVGVATVLVGAVSDPGSSILDPFCGSGTILSRAYAMGRIPFGIDMNPVAVAIASATMSSVDLDAIVGHRNDVARLSGPLFSVLESDWQRRVPNYPEQSRWYHPATLADLARLRAAIEALDDKDVAAVAEVCFSSVLLSCCSQDNHWGWVCDNVYPRRLVFRDAIVEYVDRLNHFIAVSSAQRAERLLHGGGEVGGDNETGVVCGDSRALLGALPSNSFDAVVTSPPYLGVIDYISSQRLTLLWSSESFVRGARDVKPLHYRQWRATEMGARYARNSTKAARTYLDDLSLIASELSRLITDDGLIALIVGASAARTPVDEILGRLSSNSLSVKFRAVREISNQRQLSPRVSSEQIVVFGRP